MLDLAMQYGKGPVLLRDLAKRQSLSAKYLDQLVGNLRVAGLLTSKRGVGGGIYLAKPPEEIKLLEVVEAVEGPLDLVSCVVHPRGCPRSKKCVTMEVWEEISQAMKGILSGITLAELAERQRRKASGG
jgi:Rrf2 family protein